LYEELHIIEIINTKIEPKKMSNHWMIAQNLFLTQILKVHLRLNLPYFGWN